MAREYVERMAYHAIEKSVMGGSRPRVVKSQSTSVITSEKALGGESTGSTMVRSGTNSTINNHRSNNHDMFFAISNMKRKLHSNMEQYSHFWERLRIPVLFRRQERPLSSCFPEHSLPESPSDESIGYDGLDENGEFEFVENIELHHMDGFVYSSKHEVGRGHDFLSLQLATPTWCDRCGDFIWGVYKQCLKCKNCEYTCHHKCRQLVTLDCANVTADGKYAEKPSRIQGETSLVEDTSQADDAESGYHTGDSTLRSSAHRPSERTLTREDLHKRIESFNHNNHGLVMTLKANTDTFQGFIRVYMNLMRPISMSLSPRPPSIYDVIGSEDSSSESEDTLTTSFYLPKDTTKVIHITSDTTAQEVIRALLQKFKITDNPRKFALYEKVHEEPKKPIMRRLTDEEKPLSLCLSWTAEGLETKRYVLQENDTGEIMWEAFSVPELDNFLRILDREEEEYIEQVKAKYQLMKIQMQQRSKEHERERGFEGDNRQPVFV